MFVQMKKLSKCCFFFIERTESVFDLWFECMCYLVLCAFSHLNLSSNSNVLGWDCVHKKSVVFFYGAIAKLKIMI